MRFMSDNIILIGMPASGKTTLGRMLSEEIGFRFLDTDARIIQEQGKLLMEIIAQDGLDRFLDIEGETCAGLDVSRTVIATGGSVIYRENGMRRLKELGPVVYLHASYEEIRFRLGDLVSRGVALRPGQSLKDLYEERVPLYERWADVTLAEQSWEPEELARQLLELVKGVV